MNPETRAVDEQVDRSICGETPEPEVPEFLKAPGESRVIGNRQVQVKELSEGPEEPLGLTEREAKDHADRQGSLDGQVRVGPLTAGPPGGRRLPGIQRGFGEPDREGAPLPESRFVVSPVPYPVPGLGLLVLAALGIPHSAVAPGSGRGIVKMPSHPEPCTNASGCPFSKSRES